MAPPASGLYRFSANGNVIGGRPPRPVRIRHAACPTSRPTQCASRRTAARSPTAVPLLRGLTALWTPSNATGLYWPNQNNGLGVEDYTDPDWIDSTHFTVSHSGATIGTQSMWGVQHASSPASGPGWYESGATGTGFQGIVSRSGQISALFEDDAAAWLPPRRTRRDLALHRLGPLRRRGHGFNLQCKVTLIAAQSSDPSDYSPTFSADGTKLLWGDDQGVEIATSRT